MADYTAGTVGVPVTPDASGWEAKAKAKLNPIAAKLGESLGDIMGRQIAKQLPPAIAAALGASVPQARRKGDDSGEAFGGAFARKAQTRIRAALAALPEAQIGASTTAAEQKLKDLRLELATLSEKRIGVDIDEREALADLAAIKLELSELNRSAASVEVRVNTGAAIAELAAFEALVRSVGDETEVISTGRGGRGGLSKATDFAKDMGTSIARAAAQATALAAVIAVVTAALAPAIIAATGFAVALSAPLGAAGVGLTLFGFLATVGASRISEIGKEIDDLRAKAATLTDKKAAKEAMAQADALEASLTTSQKAFLDAKSSLSEAFDGFLAGPGGDALMRPLTAVLGLLEKSLPVVEPLLVAVSDAISDVLDSAGAAVDGGGLAAFIETLAPLAGPAIASIVDILGGLGSVLNTILTAAAPTGVAALDGIADAVGRLAEYLQSDAGQAQLQEFFDWLTTDGAAALEHVWMMAEAFGEFVAAAWPLGEAILGGAAAITTMAANSPLIDVMAGVWGILADAIGYVVLSLAAAMDMWGLMLQALGKVPGFGWATEAGDKMRAAAKDAVDLGNRILDIPDKKDVNITFWERTIRSIEFSNIEGKRDDAMASRGPGNALGTRNWTGGGTWVGEQGPEWVNLPRGSQVVANHKLNDPSTWAGFGLPAAVGAPAPSAAVDMSAVASAVERAAENGMVRGFGHFGVLPGQNFRLVLEG